MVTRLTRRVSVYYHQFIFGNLKATDFSFATGKHPPEAISFHREAILLPAFHYR